MDPTLSSTYTTPATVSSDNGAVISVEIFNGYDTVISTNATLTVKQEVLPSIYNPPANQTVNAGASATFSINATGTAPLSYQWSKNGTPISGATSRSYTTPATVIGDNGSRYTIFVTNGLGHQTSAFATLTVNPPATPPSITSQPSNQSVAVGATATFSVTASGTAPFSYQWRKNGTAISGATSASYTTPATVAGDNGAAFSVIVTNSAGTATSANATLTVTAATAPSITTQPLDQAAAVGTTATFSVVASGSGSLSYQWRQNGAPITGATSAYYTTPATVIGDNGAIFSVVVTNGVGSATSNNATLTVGTGPSITTQPINQTVTVGATATFSVVASGTGPLTYQWMRNGSMVGATSASYTTPATVSGDNGAIFKVIVSNSIASAYSNNVTLTVNPPTPIAITLSPTSVSMPVVGTQALSASVSGTTNTAVTWTCSGGTIAGTGLNITWTAPQVAGTYTITVQSQADTAKTATATLRVNPVTCAP